MKGFHIYTDHWWRNPKHAVTVEVTLTEAGPRKRPDGTVTSGPYNPSPSGWFQTVAAEVHDPESGQTFAATGEFYSANGGYQVGQQVKVRWSRKREAIEPWGSATAPEEEWNAEAGAGGGEQIGAQLSGAGLSADQAARVQNALGALGLGAGSGVQVVRMPGAAPSAAPDPVEQLERLARLHESGALTDEEFTREKQRLLGA
jgi:hypothetical protein